MRNTLKKLLSLALATIMLVAMFGCAGTTGDNQGNNETLGDDYKYPEYLNLESAVPIVKEGYDDVSLDVWCVRDGLASELENSWSYKYLTEVLNVKLNITALTSSNRDQMLSQAFGANELPDIIIGCQSFFNANRLTTFGVTDKQLVNLAPYINEKLMPNAYKVFSENPGFKNPITDAEGNIWSFGLITYDDSGSSLKREYLNYAWLEKLNLEEPKTLDDLLNVLRAFKADKPNSYPMGATFASQSLTVLNALGYVTTNNRGLDPCLRNGKVVIPAADRELWKEYIQFWKTCWDEKLIDPDFFAITNKEINAQVAEGNIGFLTCSYAYNGSKNGYTDYWCPGPLTSEWNQTKQWPTAPTALTCGGFVVTSACEEVELACRFADLLFTKHNYNLFNMGPNTTAEKDILFGNEGWSYEILENGTISTIHHGLVNHPDEYANLNEYLWRVNRIWYAGCWGMHRYDGSEDDLGYVYSLGLSDPSTVTDTSEFRLEKVNGKIPEGADHAIRSANYELSPYITRDIFPTIAYFDEETSLEIEELKVLVNQYATTEFAKFVDGSRPLTDAELTDYFNKIDELGAARLLEIYTEYYAGFKAAKG